MTPVGSFLAGGVKEFSVDPPAEQQQRMKPMEEVSASEEADDIGPYRSGSSSPFSGGIGEGRDHSVLGRLVGHMARSGEGIDGEVQQTQ